MLSMTDGVGVDENWQNVRCCQVFTWLKLEGEVSG